MNKFYTLIERETGNVHSKIFTSIRSANYAASEMATYHIITEWEVK